MEESQLARMLQVQPVLLNKQDDTSFALANAPKDFSKKISISTVGSKGPVHIKVGWLLPFSPAMYRLSYACVPRLPP